MFTGLVKEIGTVKRLERVASGVRWTITAAEITPLVTVGDSVNIAGACQTVETVTGAVMTGTAIPETMRLTNYDRWRVGTGVNLELALRADDRFGGHMVSGHVDATGRVTAVAKDSGEFRVTVAFASRFDNWSIPKGAIAIDGVSLTIAAKEAGKVTVALIPETLKKTTFASVQVGDLVNLEFDQTIKAVVAVLEQSGVSEALLSRAGF